jgi:hypothetical protein
MPEDHMSRSLVVCCAFLFLAGCDLSPFSSEATSPFVAQQEVIIQGFGEADTATVGRQGIRVGEYYDFSGYDSIRISFTAKRLFLTPAFDHIQVTIGVHCRLSDSLLTAQKDISFLSKTPDIVKPYCVALTFTVPDTGVRLLLSRLRVVGWLTQYTFTP